MTWAWYLYFWTMCACAAWIGGYQAFALGIMGLACYVLAYLLWREWAKEAAYARWKKAHL